MTSRASSETRDDNLNDSWVEFSDQSSLDNGLQPPFKCNKPSVSPASSSVVRLLQEAQKESSSCINSSRSGQGSPTSCHSTAGSEMVAQIPGISQFDDEIDDANWIQQWSSRPEVVPPSVNMMSHDSYHTPSPRRHWLSIRNTRGDYLPS